MTNRDDSWRQDSELERQLTTPAAAPPADLVARLKADIPADLGGPVVDRSWTSRRPWLTLAALLVTAVGALLLTSELRREMPPSAAGESSEIAIHDAEEAVVEEDLFERAAEQAGVEQAPATSADELSRRAKRVPIDRTAAQLEPTQSEPAQSEPVRSADTVGPEDSSESSRQVSRSPNAVVPAARRERLAMPEPLVVEEQAPVAADQAVLDQTGVDQAAIDQGEVAPATSEDSSGRSPTDESRKMSAQSLGFNATADGREAASVDREWTTDPRLERLRRFLTHGRWPSPELVETSELLEVFDRPDLKPMALVFMRLLEQPPAEEGQELVVLLSRLESVTTSGADPQATELLELVKLAAQIQRPTPADQGGGD